MIGFLRETRNHLYSGKAMTLIIGNELCDLDSAVSSTCLAYFYQMLQEQRDTDSLISFCCKAQYFIPVLNWPRDHYMIKTEVEYVFSKYAILSEMLTFSSDLTDEMLDKARIILVNNQTSPFITRCYELLDHKPLNPNTKIPANCKVRIGEVASCATVIAERILAETSTNASLKKVCGFALMSLLRSVIIFDTFNFNEDKKRYTSKDLLICEQLEAGIEICANREPESRNLLYAAIVEARKDIYGLSLSQVLRKDLKLLIHEESAITIAMSCFPGTLRDLVALNDAEEDIHQFAYDNNVAVFVLIATDADDQLDYERRELGIINIKEGDLYQSIVTQLLAFTKPKLGLQEIEDLEFLDGHYYYQTNTNVTRKRIFGIISDLSNDWWNAQTDEYRGNHALAMMKKISMKEEIE